jgi:hypothetical protein
MNAVMEKRALAARDAYSALLELKKVVDEATHTAHAAELEAVHLALRTRETASVSTSLRIAMDCVGSPSFDATVSRVREKLQVAMS